MPERLTRATTNAGYPSTVQNNAVRNCRRTRIRADLPALHCCMLCSFGSVKCPPIQAQGSRCE
jgi:hypothetical protein